MYFYSETTNGFYITGIGEQERPDDAVEITEEQWVSLREGQANGLVITMDENNQPVLTEPVIDYIAIANAHLEYLVDQANEYMNSKQWPGKAAIGRLKGEELAQYNLWLDYLDALELVDTSSAPDIEWPTPPAVQAR
ncbi:tail fiber assembly protein [Escherichia coli]|nr:tail fiber assembly protein [Escherichia coli]MDT8929343.1 tail fiber assembly protein [Escherichia coli]OJP22333.1 phage tail protein [Escherichia coli]HDP7078193.1 tail fiber assembly protein [Escherichia coli]